MDDVKDKIESLDGVISSKLTEENGDLEEVHVVADRSRQPKRLVRDIETIIQVTCDREIDHKKISIARLDREKGEQKQKSRVELISAYQKNNEPTCCYRVRVGEEVVEEEITSSPVESTIRLAARGMAEILEKYDLINGQLRLENVFKTGIGSDIVVVEISLFFEGHNMWGGKKLLGSVYIENNPALAGAKATLKALNRLLLDHSQN